jgi:rod shape-determining protein MreB
LFARKIGIDLGRSSTQVCVRGEGVVVDEPTARMEARVGSSSPFSIIAHLLAQAQGRQRLFRPEVMMCVPCHAGGEQRRELTQAAIDGGARQAWLVEAPLAAAIGAGLKVATPHPHLVLDLGAGSAQAAVISDSSIVAARTGPAGGEHLDAAISAYVQARRGLTIGSSAAEGAKQALGMGIPGASAETVVLRAAGSRKPVAVTADEVRAAIEPVLAVMVGAMRQALDETPGRVATRAAEQGLVLTGGGALLPGLDRYLAAQTGLAVRVADDPRTCAVRGTQRALGELEVVHRRQLYVR